MELKSYPGSNGPDRLSYLSAFANLRSFTKAHPFFCAIIDHFILAPAYIFEKETFKNSLSCSVNCLYCMQNEKWYIIINPAANRGLVTKLWEKILPQLKTHLADFTFAFTQYRGHGMELAADAIRQGYRHLIGVGGDGTNNEVVNGIFSQNIVEPTEIVYALLPIGTGNDWIRSYGIPKKIDAWLNMLAFGNTRFQDIGLVHYHKQGHPAQRYFANVAGMAYDAFVVQYAERHKRWIVHKFFYLLLVMRCLFMYRLRPAKVIFDKQEESNFYYTINVGICKYSGGGMQLVPQALPDDGLLALTLARRVTKLDVLLNTYRFYNGTLGRHPKITTHQAKEITVQGLEGLSTWVEADGELLGETPVRFTILQKALRVLVP